jgi:hypothetical protein
VIMISERVSYCKKSAVSPALKEHCRALTPRPALAEHSRPTIQERSHTDGVVGRDTRGARRNVRSPQNWRESLPLARLDSQIAAPLWHHS